MRPFFVGEMSSPVTRKSSSPAMAPNEELVELVVMPNPFSTYVTLQFNLKEEQRVSIQLYDVKGKLVKTVFDGETQAGVHRISIDGSNMANGAYFCKINISGQQSLRKLVLQK
jgi:spore coat protein A, manganese oxidase